MTRNGERKQKGENGSFPRREGGVFTIDAAALGAGVGGDVGGDHVPGKAGVGDPRLVEEASVVPVDRRRPLDQLRAERIRPRLEAERSSFIKIHSI